MKKRFNAIISSLADIFFAYPCPVCKKNLDIKHNVICEVCKKDIVFFSDPICDMCGGELDGLLDICSKCIVNDKPSWNSAISLFRMEKLGKELLHLYKYSKQIELAHPLAILAAEHIKIKNIDFDFVVPVPLFWLRKLKRGFNQSDIISEIIAKNLNIPLNNSLKRIKNTKQQAKLVRNERKKNLIGVFSVLKDEKIKNSSILLVDDVLTTGSTLSAAANVLLEAGAKKITIFTLARR